MAVTASEFRCKCERKLDIDADGDQKKPHVLATLPCLARTVDAEISKKDEPGDQKSTARALKAPVGMVSVEPKKKE